MACDPVDPDADANRRLQIVASLVSLHLRPPCRDIVRRWWGLLLPQMPEAGLRLSACDQGLAATRPSPIDTDASRSGKLAGCASGLCCYRPVVSGFWIAHGSEGCEGCDATPSMSSQEPPSRA